MHKGKPHTLGQNLHSGGVTWAGGQTAPNTSYSGSFSNMPSFTDNIIKEVVPSYGNTGYSPSDALALAKGAGQDAWAGLSNMGGKLFTKGGMEGFGSAMSGLGSLASGWAALKNLKLSRQAMENQQNQWQTNYDAQRLATNNAIANQNAWKQAQGRTDYGSYVGGKPAGTQYVG
jgi:hypothetical protein